MKSNLLINVPQATRFIGFLFIPVIMLGLAIGNATYANLLPKNVAISKPTANSQKESNFLSQLAKKVLPNVPTTAPTATPTNKQGDNSGSSNEVHNNNNANSNNSSNSNTSQTQVTQAPTNTPAANTSPTIPVPTSQAQAQPTKVPTTAPTNAAPTPTPIVTRLAVLGCYDFGLNYCRQGLPSNGSVYGGRLRVRNASTGELLASDTLNGDGRVTISGLPIDNELEVVLLPPTDNPNYCGDREYVKFLSYRTYISIELDLYRNVSPCISS